MRHIDLVPSPRTPTHATKYHYANANSEAVGPVEESDLKALYAKGEISRDTNVLPEGSDSWRPYGSLMPAVPPPPSGSLAPPVPAVPIVQPAPEPTQRCPYCSELVAQSAKKCKHCGEILDVALRAAEEAKRHGPSNTPMVFMNAGGGGGGSSAAASSGGGMAGPIVGTKSRVVAAVLAFFFGWIGIHKFYLGQIGWGIIYVLFSWTAIPWFVSLIEGVLYLLSTERAFALKYG